MHYIGIDIGTSSICGVCYDPATEECKVVTKPNTAAIATQQAWAFQQDAHRILFIVDELIEELMVEDVVSIGFSGQMHGMLYVDEGGQAVSPLYTWQDGSGDQLYKDGKSYAQWLTEKTGHKVSTGYGLVTHFYHMCNNTLPQNVAHLCTVMDYVVMNLCSEKQPLCEPSNAASLGFFDKRQMCFDVEALRCVGIDEKILPKVCEADTIAGYYSHKGSNTPVYVAIGDNQSSFFGSVQQRESSILVTIGTSSQLSVYSPDYVEVESLDTRTLPGGGYILVGAALCGGCSLSMLKDFFGRSVEYFTGQRPSDEVLYDRMFGEYDIEQAIPTVETTFEGSRLDPTRRGSITDITLRNFTPEALVEGFMRGICKELHDFYLALPEPLRRNCTELVGTGNALRRNARLREVLASTFGLPLTLSTKNEEAAMGATTILHLGR